MIELLKKIQERYRSEKEGNAELSSEFYKEERYIDRVINELNWERSSPQEKQERRLKVLSKLKGVNFSNTNYQYNGYEEKVIKFYDSLINVKEEIESKELDANIEKLLALILIEMRSIDKNVRMKDIAHIDQETFREAIQRCGSQVKYKEQLLNDLNYLHSKPIA